MCIIENINWNVASCAISAIMAVLAGATLWVSYKQRRDDLRARLSFEIISHDDMLLLKVSNIGKETTYNVQLKFTGKPITENFSLAIRKCFASLESKKIALVSGRSVYFLISYVYSSNKSFTIADENISNETVNKWLDKNINENIHVIGKYCDKYNIDETFSLNNYIGCRSLIIYSPTESALREISKGISCKNNLHSPIQKRIEDIYYLMEKISKNIETE